MDEENLWDMRHIYGSDPDGKISLMMDWAGLSGCEVSDPWYTRDFERAYRDIVQGCEGLIAALEKGGGSQ
jgi:protein-tyrosine phosphatase